MSTITEKDYKLAFQEFQDKLNSPKFTECKKLDELRLLELRLGQLRDTYWIKPCLKNWPCAFDQDHSNIDDLQRRVAVHKLSLLRECEAEKVAQKIHNNAAAHGNPSNINKTIQISEPMSYIRYI